MNGPPGLLVLTSNLPRWAGDSTTPFVLDVAHDLGRRGWRVEVLAPHAPGAARRETLDGVAVHRFRYLLPERAQTLCYRGGALVNLAGSRSAAAQAPLLVAAELAATERLLRTGRFAALHSHWLLPQGWVAGLSARGRVPHLATVHGGDVFGLRSGPLTAFKRSALRRADAVSVNSAATEAAVRELLPGHPRVQRIPMGVALNAPDPELTAAFRADYRRGAGPLLVYVGRIIPDKGVDDAVEALRLLLAELPDATLVLAGEGQYREDLARGVERSGLAGRVFLPGWVAPARVASLLAAADVALAPSRIGAGGWTEAQGLSVAEALAVARPVVATRVGGLADTVQDGVTGLLVGQRAPDALAAAVRRLVADPHEAAAFGRAGQAWVRAHLSRDACADAFDGLLRELVTRRGGTAR